jgi:hypothetical protein
MCCIKYYHDTSRYVDSSIILACYKILTVCAAKMRLYAFTFKFTALLEDFSNTGQEGYVQIHTVC